MKSLYKLTTIFAVFMLIACISSAQPFDCGSDGSDGAFVYANPASPETILFDPTDITMVGRELDTDCDGIYHFTSIEIPENITLRLRADKAGWAPIYWLSQDDVVVSGTIDLSGAPGHPAMVDEPGWLSIPGPGGGPGGWGNNILLAIPRHSGFSAGDRNSFLYPLTGGKGGNGPSDDLSGGGGGGGGALLLASNTKIKMNGSIIANGGTGGEKLTNPPEPYYSSPGFQGEGGSLRFLAPEFTGTGLIQTEGYPINYSYVRIESNDYSFTGTIQSTEFRSVALIPSATYILPSVFTQPEFRVVRIGGVELPPRPEGNFEIPDIVLNTQEPVTIEIEAKNIPLGTKFQIFLWSQTEHVIQLESSELAGTLASATATASCIIPNGYTRGFVYASWTNE